MVFKAVPAITFIFVRIVYNGRYLYRECKGACATPYGGATGTSAVSIGHNGWWAITDVLVPNVYNEPLPTEDVTGTGQGTGR